MREEEKEDKEIVRGSDARDQKKKEKKEWKKQRNRGKFETTRDDVSSIRSRKLFFFWLSKIGRKKRKKGTVIRIHACKEREGLEQQNDARIACQSGSEQT